MQFANNQQKAAIHAILRKMGMDKDVEYKRDLVINASKGRCTSTRDLYYGEAQELINSLNGALGQSDEDIRANNMRRKIIGIARAAGWEKDGKADMDRINGWCQSRGQFHKGLNEHTYSELPALVTQFQKAFKK